MPFLALLAKGIQALFKNGDEVMDVAGKVVKLGGKLIKDMNASGFDRFEAYQLYQARHAYYAAREAGSISNRTFTVPLIQSNTRNAIADFSDSLIDGYTAVVPDYRLLSDQYARAMLVSRLDAAARGSIGSVSDYWSADNRSAVPGYEDVLESSLAPLNARESELSGIRTDAMKTSTLQRLRKSTLRMPPVIRAEAKVLSRQKKEANAGMDTIARLRDRAFPRGIGESGEPNVVWEFRYTHGEAKSLSMTLVGFDDGCFFPDACRIIFGGTFPATGPRITWNVDFSSLGSEETREPVVAENFELDAAGQGLYGFAPTPGAIPGFQFRGKLEIALSRVGTAMREVIDFTDLPKHYDPVTGEGVYSWFINFDIMLSLFSTGDIAGHLLTSDELTMWFFAYGPSAFDPQELVTRVDTEGAYFTKQVVTLSGDQVEVDDATGPNASQRCATVGVAIPATLLRDAELRFAIGFSHNDGEVTLAADDFISVEFQNIRIIGTSRNVALREEDVSYLTPNGFVHIPARARAIDLCGITLDGGNAADPVAGVVPALYGLLPNPREFSTAWRKFLRVQEGLLSEQADIDAFNARWEANFPVGQAPDIGLVADVSNWALSTSVWGRTLNKEVLADFIEEQLTWLYSFGEGAIGHQISREIVGGSSTLL
jgi:hypothetical protein